MGMEIRTYRLRLGKVLSSIVGRFIGDRINLLDKQSFSGFINSANAAAATAASALGTWHWTLHYIPGGKCGVKF